jgi:hypothetical protein
VVRFLLAKYILLLYDIDMNKEINVYWAPSFIDKEDDWSMMYPKPKTLFSELMSKRVNAGDKQSIFSCPAVSNKFKKTLVLNNAVSCKYEFDTIENNLISPTTKEYISAAFTRIPAISYGPLVEFSVGYLFFADQPLEIEMNAPTFHEPRYTKYGTVVPGGFDIGQWFRPLNFELQAWKSSGEIVLEEGEPLMYVNFKTDKKINLYRFNMSDAIGRYVRSNTKSQDLFGPGQSLLNKYKKFNNAGLKEKIITEIKKNLIEEEPYTF